MLGGKAELKRSFYMLLKIQHTIVMDITGLADNHNMYRHQLSCLLSVLHYSQIWQQGKIIIIRVR